MAPWWSALPATDARTTEKNIKLVQARQGFVDECVMAEHARYTPRQRRQHRVETRRRPLTTHTPRLRHPPTLSKRNATLWWRPSDTQRCDKIKPMYGQLTKSDKKKVNKKPPILHKRKLRGGNDRSKNSKPRATYPRPPLSPATRVLPPPSIGRQLPCGCISPNRHNNRHMLRRRGGGGGKGGDNESAVLATSRPNQPTAPSARGDAFSTLTSFYAAMLEAWDPASAT